MSKLLRLTLLGNRHCNKSSLTSIRNISSSLARYEKPVSVASESASAKDPSRLGGVTHLVKPYHKYALVWAGKYKSIAEVPERVPHGILDSALNKARVKIAIWMMIATALMAGATVYNGKQAARRGENLAIIGMEQQKKLREEGIKEQEAADAAKAKK
ncbi:hypothetical protein C0J52_11947 [Blattella germanica]|nr:hypothetical protein C0J52_11947 [Blattella germanica]